MATAGRARRRRVAASMIAACLCLLTSCTNVICGAMSIDTIALTFADRQRCFVPDYCDASATLEMQLRLSKHFDVVVYLPSNVTAPLPLCVFAYEAHDTFMQFASAIASQGIIVAAFPVYDLARSWEFAMDLLHVAAEMLAENATPSSPIYDRMLSSQVSVMGAGAAASSPLMVGLSALSLYSSRLARQPAIVALAPRLDDFQGLSYALTSITSPVLIIAAQNDCRHPNEGHAIPAYNGVNRWVGQCKTYVEILQGHSCLFADQELASECAIDELPCLGSDAAISGPVQRALASSMVAEWLAFVIGGNLTQWAGFNDALRLRNGASIAFMQSCQVHNKSHDVPFSIAAHR